MEFKEEKLVLARKVILINARIITVVNARFIFTSETVVNFMSTSFQAHLPVFFDTVGAVSI